jgi:hypothetical protein
MCRCKKVACPLLPCKTALFIRENLFQKEDYLKLKEDLFGEKTAAEIFDEIKKGNFSLLSGIIRE